jgi:voltage-dependent calcium channel L type alpha-1D
MLKWYQQSDVIVYVLEIMNYIFTAIFALEVIIKIIAQGFIVFFREGWNIFDFLIAFASCLSIIVSAHTSLEIKGAITLLRSFRILRILRLLKRGGKNLYMIFNTFVITL